MLTVLHPTAAAVLQTANQELCANADDRAASLGWLSFWGGLAGSMFRRLPCRLLDNLGLRRFAAFGLLPLAFGSPFSSPVVAFATSGNSFLSLIPG